jgi:hypothetical protein
MSSVPIRQLHPGLRSVLHKLKVKIQVYLLFHGLALVLATLCAGFFATLAIDWFHFQIRKLELPVAFRGVLVFGVVAAIAWVLAFEVFLKLAKDKGNRALALILERRFPALNDRLITAVEMSGASSAPSTPLTESMLDQTIADVASSADGLKLSDVFDWKPLIYSCLMGVVLLSGVGIVAAASPQTFERWTRAFVDFDKVYWLRETQLDVVVLAEPGDRVREFEESGGGYVYKHPRGADLKLLVSVPEGENPMGNTWVVPDGVEIEYLFRECGDRRKVVGGDVKPLARRGERKFQFKISSVLECMEFWISGNDYINRRPYRIEIVDPPEADQIALLCDYPDYTRLDLENLDERRVQGQRQLSIPIETAFVFSMHANKPLRNVVLQAGPYEFSIGQFTLDNKDEEENEPQDIAKVRMQNETGSYGAAKTLESSWIERVLSEDRQSIQIPFVLTTKNAEQVADRSLRLPAELGKRWLLPPDSDIKIYLEDRDGIISAEPKQFTILGTVDQPPEVNTDKYGIGESITRQASIPIQGLIIDDYGIETARFDFKVDEAEGFRPRPFRKPPSKLPLEHQLARDEKEEYERFEVTPLDLTIGQTLTLTVYARDADNLNGPHEVRSTSYTFKIVTREELLGKLYDRELNLRRQFEQIISEVERTRDDLIKHRGVAVEIDGLKASGNVSVNAISEKQIELVNCAERSSHQIGKNRAETAAIREGFERILEELVNNKVHTRQQNDRIEGLILTPLTGITEVDFPAADEAIGLFRQANEEGEDPKPRIDQSINELETMLLHMRAVLAEMSDLAEFHELLKDFKELIEQEEELHEDTKDKQKNQLKEKLKGLGL